MAVEDKISRDCWKLLEKASQSFLEGAESLNVKKTIVEIGGGLAPQVTDIKPHISQSDLEKARNLHQYILSKTAYHQQNTKRYLKLV